METVAVLYSDVPDDAPPDERDVLIQVETVCQALARLGYEAAALPFSFDLGRVAERLRALAPVCVFNLVETVGGRGRWIHLAPALLDWLEIPYTGSGTDAMFQTSNKLVAKRVLRGAGVRTPPWISLDDGFADGMTAGDRLLVKSVWEHASVGLDDDALLPAADRPQCLAALASRRDRLGGACFAERYVEGREFNLALLSHGADVQVLPPAEIRFVDYPAGKARIVGYRAKWEETSFEYRHTVRSFDFGREDAALVARLAEIAKRCWTVFGLRGYARVDFRVDEARTPWVLEVNANPCLSPDAGFAAAAARAGLALHEVIERLLIVRSTGHVPHPPRTR